MDQQERRMMPDSDTQQVSASSELSPTTAPPQESRGRRSALVIVFLVMFIDLLGFGLVLPLLPRYGREFLDPLFPGEAHSILKYTILGLLAISFSFMQFIFAPIWGS